MSPALSTRYICMTLATLTMLQASSMLACNVSNPSQKVLQEFVGTQGVQASPGRNVTTTQVASDTVCDVPVLHKPS